MPSDREERPGHSGPADHQRTIDGLSPTEWVEPATASELATALAEAASRDWVVAPVGGGTALALGNVPDRVDLAISTARLNQILDYEPTDLTLSVGSGARFADVAATLGERGQCLPLDVAEPERATIGGLIATALAGPRRLGSGTLRDLLIGVETALPNGTLAKAGGMVVKNVTGFDLMRLYHGSLGTLGVIVSANFKVLPLARSDVTVVIACESLDQALALAGAIRAHRLQPLALEVAWQADTWTLAARFAGRERPVAQRIALIEAMVDGPGERVESEASRVWWRRYMAEQALDRPGSDGVLVRWSVRPSETPGLAHALIRELKESIATLDWLGISVGLGTVIGRLRMTEMAESEGMLDERQHAWQALAENVQVLAAPPAWKRGIDVWGELPETLDLMRDLKAQFDPGRTLNRGRFVGRI